MPLPNGAAIKAIRQAKGLKGVDLAVAVGISHGHLFNIESSRRKRASDEVLDRIARNLGVPVAAISHHPECPTPVTAGARDVA
jgi:transcriptional regulator with XRE-family HTH domain